MKIIKNLIIITLIFNLGNIFVSYADEMGSTETNQLLSDILLSEDNIVITDIQGYDVTNQYLTTLKAISKDTNEGELVELMSTNALRIDTISMRDYGERHSFQEYRPKLFSGTTPNGIKYNIEVTTKISGSYYINNQGQVVKISQNMDLFLPENHFFWEIWATGKDMGTRQNGSGLTFWYKYDVMGRNPHDSNFTRILGNVYEAKGI